MQLLQQERPSHDNNVKFSQPQSKASIKINKGVHKPNERQKMQN